MLQGDGYGLISIEDADFKISRGTLVEVAVMVTRYLQA